MGTYLKIVKDNIIKVGNGTYSQEEIKAINAEMNEKIKEIADTLNTTHGGKYMFGGSNVDEAPIKLIENPDGTVKLEINKNSNTEDLKADISDGTSIDYNVSVGEIFNVKDENGKTVNLLDEVNRLSKLMNDIANGDEQTSANARKELLGDEKKYR